MRIEIDITEPGGDALSCGFIVFILGVLIIYLYVAHHYVEHGKNNEEKINPLTSSLNDKNKKDE